MKKITLLTGLLLATGFSSVASAHTYGGTLGSVATATDRWYFQCLSSTNNRVSVSINRTAGTPCVRVTYEATGQNATSCGGASATFNIATGAGAKVFRVNKNPAKTGTNSYSVIAHCWNSNNTHVDSQQTTPQIYLQNN